MSPSQLLRLWLISFQFLMLFLGNSAYGEFFFKSEKEARTKTLKAGTENRQTPKQVFSGQYAVRKVPQYWQSLQVATPTTSSKNINIRIHPLQLVPMLTDKKTKASFRTDIDVVVSSGFTIGPSVSYQQTSEWDDTALAGGKIRGKNESKLELGLLSNISLTGNTSEGGLLVRPHLYWVNVLGEGNNDKGKIVEGSSRPGWRAGSELVFQKILPSGLNFEIGAGFTYHFIPYSIGYESPSSSATPSSTFMPTVTAGIGWAF